MEDQASSKSLILNYGLYYGLIIVFTNLILYAVGMHLTTNGGLINIGVLAICIILFPILGNSKYKESNGGFLSWGQAVKIGVGIVLIGTLINVVYGRIFSTLIEPDFYTQVAEVQTQGYLESGLTEEQAKAQVEMQSKFQGTIIGDALGLLFFAFLGFVVAAIAGAVMKRTEEDNY